MLAECLFVATLFIPPDDRPFFRNDSVTCIPATRTDYYISDWHELTIVQLGTIYRIPLVRHNGRYEIQYRIGGEFASYRHVDIENAEDRFGEALVDSQWGSIMVAILGPKEGI